MDSEILFSITKDGLQSLKSDEDVEKPSLGILKMYFIIENLILTINLKSDTL